MEIIHIAGRKSESKPLVTDEATCKCEGELRGHYGFCEYGLGTFQICKECSTPYNFVEDLG